MDFSGSETYDDSDDVKDDVKRGCLPCLLRFFGISLGIVISGIVLAAFLLTTDLGRVWLLGKINRAISPAHLTVKEWNAGFFGESRLHGVDYYSPNDGLCVDIEEVILSKGVFALIPVGKLSLGEIILESPVVSYDSHEAEENRAQSAEDAVSEGGAFFLPALDIGGTILLKNGYLFVKDNGHTLFKSDNLQGRLVVDSFWKPFGFNVNGAAGRGTFGVTADLQSVNSLINGGDSDYTDKIVLQLDTVDLAAFTSVLNMAGSPVVPHAGIAEGALTMERSGGAGLLKLEGGLLIEKMQLNSVEGEASPAGDVALLVDAEIKNDLCVFRKCDFSSPWGQVKLLGSLRQLEKSRRLTGDIKADVDFDIAAIVRDFRNLLSIDDDLQISKGRLSGAFMMQDSSGGKRLETSLKSSALVMRYKNRPVSLERNPSLILKIYLPDGALPDVEELRLQGSFVDVYGQGNIRQGVVKGYVDLSQFSHDFKGLLKNGVALGGAAHFNLSTRPSGDSVAFDLISKLSGFNVTSAGFGASSVKEGSFTFKGNVNGIAAAGKLADLRFKDLDYDLRLNKSRLHGAAKRFVPVQNGSELPVLRDFALNADVQIVDLIKASGVILKRKTYIDALACHGDILLNAAVESANNVAKIRVNGAGRNIALKIAGQNINESEMHLEGAATLDAEHDNLSLSGVNINSGFADIKIPGWFVGFSENREGLTFNGTADALLNMGVLSSFFIGDKSSCDQVSGDLKIGIKASGDGSGSDFNINGILSDFYMLADKEIFFYEKRAEVYSDLAFENKGHDALVKSFKFYSSLIDISSEGRVNDFWQQRNADFHGYMDLKFDSVNRLLRVRGIDEWTLTGHRKSRFELKGPLTGSFLQKGSFSGSAYLASLNGLGLSAGGAEITLEMRNGSLECDWQPALNGGRLKFSPVLEFSPRGTVLLLPDNLQMLDNVKITQDMVDKLMVNFNPMFQGSRVHRGTATFKINRFVSGPKAGHGDLQMDADVVLEDVSMSLAPSMRKLLSMINVKSSAYQVKRLPMHVSVRKERIYLEPMTMVFSKQPVVFSGSVGFDSTIKYLIEIPVGDTISRKTGLNLPKGLSVKVPVTGTVDNPRLDTGGLEKTFGGFIKNTLGDDALKGVTDFLEQLKKDLR